MNTMNIFEELQQRGLLSQCSHPQLLEEQLTSEKITFYLGIDPTGASLHCGHLVPLLLAQRLQQAGHRPLVLIGGGTAMIGDPSGKDEMRKLLEQSQINTNTAALRQQVSNFIDFSSGKALLLDNSDWLTKLQYIPFLRDIGRHFSVNRMLSFDTYRTRMKTGLSFIEFNYQLLQSYDFLELSRRYGCTLQIGGDDQWGNMVAGIELIRRVEGTEVQALTVPLVARSDGKKMGKTEGGAIFLDANLSSPYDFYQYWRNSSDADVGRFLLLYSSLPLAECQGLAALRGRETNHAKEVLAYQITAMVHGTKVASEMQQAADAGFASGGKRQSIPGKALSYNKLSEGIEALSLFCDAGLVNSRREGRRLFEQGGAWVNDCRIDRAEQLLGLTDLLAADEQAELLLRAGKKRLFRFYIEN